MRSASEKRFEEGPDRISSGGRRVARVGCGTREGEKRLSRGTQRRTTTGRPRREVRPGRKAVSERSRRKAEGC